MSLHEGIASLYRAENWGSGIQSDELGQGLEPRTVWEGKVVQSCLTLCNLMDCTVHGILQARILERVAIPFSRGSSQPRDQTQVFCIAGRFFTIWTSSSELSEPSEFSSLNWKLWAIWVLWFGELQTRELPYTYQGFGVEHCFASEVGISLVQKMGMNMPAWENCKQWCRGMGIERGLEGKKMQL